MDRPPDPAAPGRPARRPDRSCTSPRWRATARRSSTSALVVGADLPQVVGTMRNFIPERMVRATGRMMRMNIDDGDIFMGEFANGAIGSIQTSFVTVGNYPGHRGADLRRARARSSAGWSRSSASPRRSRWPRRTTSSSRSWRSPSASTRPAATPREIVAHALLRQPDQQTSSTRSSTDGDATRATSTTAPGSRRRSTPSSGRSASAAG